MSTVQLLEYEPQMQTELSSRHAARQSHLPRWELPRQQACQQGDVLFYIGGTRDRTYMVLEGEVLILRDGRPVDLIEAGEYLDEALWVGATAIAYTDCTVVDVSSQPAQRLAALGA